MKVYDVSVDTIALAVTPIGNRLYKLARDTKLCVHTDEGLYEFVIKKYFVSNFRSGMRLIDAVVDQIGDEEKSLCYLFHDLIYTPCAALGMEHPLSRKKGDELLHAALIWAKMPKWKANLVYYSVRLFGHSAYWDDDALTSANSKLFSFEWKGK